MQGTQEAVRIGEKATRTVDLVRETEGIVWCGWMDKRQGKKGDRKEVSGQNVQTAVKQAAQPEQKMWSVRNCVAKTLPKGSGNLLVSSNDIQIFFLLNTEVRICNWWKVCSSTCFDSCFSTFLKYHIQIWILYLQILYLASLWHY